MSTYNIHGSKPVRKILTQYQEEMRRLQAEQNQIADQIIAEIEQAKLNDIRAGISKV
jgi:hypothetical protein